MALPLNTTGLEFASWLPRFLQRSVQMQGVIDVEAREADRFEADRTDLMDQMFPQTATWGLKLWEQSLQLPVEPVDETSTPLTDEERRVIIMTKLRSNKVESALAWTEVLDSYGIVFSVRVDHELGEIHINITENPSAYSQAQLERLIVSVSPAHFDLFFTYDGFILGTSLFGDPL